MDCSPNYWFWTIY